MTLVYPLVETQQAQNATSEDGPQPDPSKFVGIAIANLSRTDAVVRFTAHDPTGAEISGPDNRQSGRVHPGSGSTTRTGRPADLWQALCPIGRTSAAST